MQVAFKKGKDHVENIFHLQGQEQVHCTGKRNYHTGAGSEMLLPVRTPCCRDHEPVPLEEKMREFGVDAKEIKTAVLQTETLLDRMQEKESK